MQVGWWNRVVLGRSWGESGKSEVADPVGAAAAVAAAFNTPLAAVLFALEEVIGDLHAPILDRWCWLQRPLGDVAIVLGNEPLFKVPQYQLVSPWELVCTDPRSAWRAGIRGVYASCSANACVIPEVSKQDGVVSTRGRRNVGRRDGLVCAASRWASATSMWATR